MVLYNVNGLDAPYGTWTAVVWEDTPSANITAGMLVKVSAKNTTELTTTTYKTAVDAGYVKVEKSDASGDEALICGIAMYDGTSGEAISLATRGIFLMPVGASVTLGEILCQDQANTSGNASIRLVDAETGGRQIGIALTPADAAGDYVLVLCTGIAGHTGAVA